MDKFLKNRIFLISVIIVLLFIGLNFVIPQKYFLDHLRNFAFKASMPITKYFYQSGGRTGGFFYNLSQINKLADEKNELEKKNAELTLENVKLEETLKENQLLREELGLKSEIKDKELAAADIIGRGPTDISGNLIINKGKKDGLNVGMPVVSGGTLLGKLTEVLEDYSRVTLIVDQSSIVNAMVEETRAAGIVRGEVGFNLKIESVPQEFPLKIGQRVITSGLGETMPKGLVIGEVAEVLSPESEIFQTARIKPAADFNHLEIVFIIKT